MIKHIFVFSTVQQPFIKITVAAHFMYKQGKSCN